MVPMNGFDTIQHRDRDRDSSLPRPSTQAPGDGHLLKALGEELAISGLIFKACPSIGIPWSGLDTELGSGDPRDLTPL